MAFFDTLKQNLMTASQIAMDKAKNTAEILKLKDQIRQDKREIRSATFKIGEIYRELHSEDYEEAYDCLLYTSPSPRDLSTSRMPSSA